MMRASRKCWLFDETGAGFDAVTFNCCESQDTFFKQELIGTDLYSRRQVSKGATQIADYFSAVTCRKDEHRRIEAEGARLDK